MRKVLLSLALGCGLVVFGFEQANACDPSYWTYEEESGDCLQISGAEGDGYLIENACSEAIDVSVKDCVGSCPAASTLAPGAQAPLQLPSKPKGDDTFRLTTDQGDSVTYTFLENICPSSEGDCSVGRAGLR